VLLVAALIEARSFERLGLLAEAIHDDAPLADFLRGLLASEARHHGLYVRLAEELAPGPETRARLRELAEHEASILAEPTRLVRLHS